MPIIEGVILKMLLRSKRIQRLKVLNLVFCLFRDNKSNLLSDTRKELICEGIIRVQLYIDLHAFQNAQCNCSQV